MSTPSTEDESGDQQLCPPKKGQIPQQTLGFQTPGGWRYDWTPKNILKTPFTPGGMTGRLGKNGPMACLMQSAAASCGEKILIFEKQQPLLIPFSEFAKGKGLFEFSENLWNVENYTIYTYTLFA